MAQRGVWNLHLGHLRCEQNSIKKYVCSCLTVNTLYTTIGEAPIHLAAEEGHVPVIEYLHEHGADLDIQNKDGKIYLLQ